jgi:hypothetical protein
MLRKNPIIKAYREVRYQLRCLFFPHNVIKLSHVSRGWHDRDYLMYHACFQLLVDFVELEQLFRSWGDKRVKRHTNRQEMREFVYGLITPEGKAEYYGDWYDDEMKKFTDANLEAKYSNDAEILRLYEWYKDKGYRFDYEKYRKLTGTKLKAKRGSGTFSFEHVETGEPKIITPAEMREIQEEHEITVKANLQRLIDIRETLWT